MKTWIAFFLLFTTTANAAEWSAQLISHSRLADDDTYQTGTWYGIQFNYQSDDSFLFVSQEKVTVIPLWGSHSLTMTGLGVGTTWQVTPRFRIFGQIGYYSVDVDRFGTRDWNEGLYYYFNGRFGFSMPDLAPLSFDYYTIEIEDTFGGTIGFELEKPITDRLSVGFVMSYRAMRISEYLRVDRQAWLDAGVGWWENGIDRNYSSLDFGVSLRYTLK